ncbi:MAG: ThuA domain-containing protein [Pseudomonadaceae bacterium]|nr:ThuA domain-containing protein [Pseudomonadaceae bacterium]
MDKEILLVTKGHPFEKQPFFDVFDEMQGVGYTHVEQPAAQALFSVEEAARFDAFVLYDMPGISFHGDSGPAFAEPSDRFKRRFLELLDAGYGFVFLHHAIAGWPAWPEYAEIVGGRFLYLPGELRGVARQDSGYRHGVDHTVSVVADHPITAGLPKQFDITDELYLYEVFEEDVTPLLASNYGFAKENFYSAARVVRDGKMFDNEGWEHEPGSNLIGWCKTYGKSRIVYLQCGDDPIAYANENFQKLLSNAIDWVSHR